MGDLAATGIEPSWPFINSGIDFCGPFQLQYIRRKEFQEAEGYVAVFACWL